jgi:hypothetical protein
MMKEGTPAVHASTVREFLQIISDQAKAATAGIERPGLLQMSRLHPASEQLVPSRYVIGDVEHMIEAAVGRLRQVSGEAINMTPQVEEGSVIVLGKCHRKCHRLERQPVTLDR